MQVARRREMKMMVVEVGLWGELAVEDGEESVLKVSRAADGFAASSSWEGSGVGFVGVKIDKESEPIVGKGASFFEIVLNQCVKCLGEMKSWSKTKGVWFGLVGKKKGESLVETSFRSCLLFTADDDLRLLSCY